MFSSRFLPTVIAAIVLKCGVVQAAPLLSQTGNLLNNGSFESGSFDPVTGHGIASAANNWMQWSNSGNGSSLTSELISAAEMITGYNTDVIDGNAALKFSTGGAGDGGFSFNTFHSPSWDVNAELTFSAWVYVVSGEMGLFLGANSPGTFSYTSTLSTGQWEFVSLTRAGGQTNNEPLLYSLNGAAEFIVDSLWLNYGASSTNPHPLEVPTPSSGILTGMGFLMLRLLGRTAAHRLKRKNPC